MDGSQSFSRRGVLALLLSGRLGGQGVSSRNVKAQPRGKPSGLPFHARFVDISEQAGLKFPSIYGAVEQSTYILETTGCGVAFFDYDNDGWLDLLVVNGHVYPQMDSARAGSSYAQRKLMYRNNGNGTFTELAGKLGPALLEKRVSRGAAFGDLDNDGDIDIVINDLDGPPMVLRNDGGNRQSWIRIKLLGLGRNRFALGARVKVTAGDVVQKAELRSGASYLSQNDLRLHFGLGARKVVDVIEVIWPGDGGMTRLENVDANQELEIARGAPRQ
jgi:enediyne biosynthesis protein E4